MGINVGKFVDRATGGAVKESQVNNGINTMTQIGTGGLLGYNPANGLNSGVVGSEWRKFNPVLNELYNSAGAKQGGDGPVQYDSSGRPIAPNYTSQLDSPTYRSMMSQYSSGSASPWANIAIARQNDLAETQKQELSQRNAGQTAGSLDKLAMTGGLTSGARERTIQGGQQNYMSGVQDVGNVHGKNIMQIGIDDAKGKQDLGKGLMTAEINDLMGRNQFNQNRYTADMEAWAAQQQANATRAAGEKGGGFLSSIFG